MRRLTILILGLFLLLTLGLLFPITTVSANQYGVTIGGTAEESGQATLYIPAGTYHLYAIIEASLGSYGSAICTSSILSLATDTTIGTESFESALTINQSKEYTFTVLVNATTTFGYYANFGIVLTDLDVATLVKTSVIGNAPFNLEFIFLGLICISVFSVFMRRRHNKTQNHKI